MAKRTIVQAGGIVFRSGRSGVRILVVSARRNTSRWVLPKGSVKRGEDPADAALREVLEEAGVRGRVVGPAGEAEYDTEDGRVRIHYFLIRFTREDESAGEEREVRWCAMEDAISLLTYASARRAVLETYPTVLRHVARAAARQRRAREA